MRTMSDPVSGKRCARAPCGALLDQLVWAKQISAGFCGHITSLRDMSVPESRKSHARAPCGALLDQLVWAN